jgi:hypothetical protein
MPPEQAGAVRGLGPLLDNVSAAGLLVLWATGLILVWSKWGGIASLPSLFWVKFIFVVTLTLAAGAIHLTYSEIRRTGNAALGARLAKLGPAAGLSSLLAVLFAAYTFS